MFGLPLVPITIAAFLASALLTALVRRYLLKRKLLDIPNGRSSHGVPTPRGGGVGIVVVLLLAVLLAVQRSAVSHSVGWAIIGGGLVVAITGFLDDYSPVSPWFRLLIHFASSGWALWCIGGVGPLHLGWIAWDWGWVGQLLALVSLVWMINLYNFMDGIDGLAGLEALCVGGSGSLLLSWNGLAGLADTALVLAAASAGFLVWNWPRSKIFMGDVGSGFIGFVFGVLTISSAKERPWLLWPWLILLSVFIVDSKLTLARRIIMGARWYEAHCSHAYQHAARQLGSHSKVTLAIAAVDVAWLFPLAWAACTWPKVGPLFVLVAIAPLVYTALHYDAGSGAHTTEIAPSEGGDCLGTEPATVPVKISSPVSMAHAQAQTSVLRTDLSAK